MDVFKDLSPEKIQFIQEFAAREKPLSAKDVLPFLMANMKKAKDENINFSRTETQLIIELLSKDLPPAQQELIKKLKF